DAVDVVGDAHRDLLEAGEHVELGEHEVGEAVDATGVAGDDGVVPAAAAGPAGGDAVLAAGLAQPLADVVVQLGGERSLADASRVGLDDSHDAVDAGGPDAGAGDGAARGRRGGGDERVGAVVDVEHRRLPGLEDDRLALVERTVEHQSGVGDHRRDAV